MHYCEAKPHQHKHTDDPRKEERGPHSVAGRRSSTNFGPNTIIRPEKSKNIKITREENSNDGAIAREYRLTEIVKVNQNHEARLFAIYPRGSEKKNLSMSNNAQESSSNAETASNPSLPVESSTTMPEINQLLPEQGDEPENIDNIGCVLKLYSGDEFVIRGVFGKGLASTVYSVEHQSGFKYAAKLFVERDPAIPTFHELVALHQIAIVPHVNLLLLHLAGVLINPLPGFSGEVFITEECGPSIRDIMKSARLATNETHYPSFCLENVRQIGCQIGRAMAHLERLKIYYLDLKTDHVVFLKPNNRYRLQRNRIQSTIYMEDIRVKVIDFGCSKSHEEPGEEKEYRLVQPTPLRSPEVFMGLPYNETSDVWSMGCLLGQMFTGYYIFYPTSGTTEQEKIQSQFECTFNRLSELLPMKMIQESQRGGHCTLNYNFYTQRRAFNRDHLLNIIRKDADRPVYELLEFMLRWDPSRRPSFDYVLYHKFFRNI
ncbi:hypothetical protein L5515_019610 [Caenorhabditis briggsae]|uniref:Protein kinase domain-containing protein n=1 Tax=Caenorhabditis briggsae TaxID=6238 RepID=A0AAE9FPT3_CAEBR|nr:hypothetical protein L5515_019610 [Caenorhabditis briggsae]